MQQTVAEEGKGNLKIVLYSVNIYKYFLIIMAIMVCGLYNLKFDIFVTHCSKTEDKIKYVSLLLFVCFP